KTLQGVGLASNNLGGWDFHAQNLTHADLTNTVITEVNLADTTSRGFTKEQFYSTASYQAHDLFGVDLSANDLSGWNFVSQNLAYAKLASSNLANADLHNSNLAAVQFSGATLTNANFTDAQVLGADFSGA